MNRLISTVVLLTGLSAPLPAQCDFVHRAELTEAADGYGFATACLDDWVFVAAPEADGAGGNSGAVFVYRRDREDWSLWEVLIGSDVAAAHHFGICLAADGDRLVVGAYRDSQLGQGAGAVYVFRWDETSQSWLEEQKLVASDGAAADRFGNAVGIEGARLIVGAELADTPFGVDSGAAYLFELQGSSWVELQKLTAVDGRPAHGYACAVDVREDRAVVGAKFDSDGGTFAGAAYWYRDDGSSWVHQEKISSTFPEAYSGFGAGVLLGEDELFVSAPQETCSSTDGTMSVFALVSGSYEWQDGFCVPCDQPSSCGMAVAEDRATFGSASTTSQYIRARFEDDWKVVQREYLADRVSAVSMSREVVCWANADNAKVWVLTRQCDACQRTPPGQSFAGIGSGSSTDDFVGFASQGARVLVGEPTWRRVHEFRHEAGQWVKVSTFSQGTSAGKFGAAVAMDGNLAVVGAPGEDNRSGRAYVHEHDPATDRWNLLHKIVPVPRGPDWAFGSAVAIQGDTIFVAAPGDPSLATHAGSVSILQREGDVWRTQRKLLPWDGRLLSRFGTSMELEGDLLAVGAIGAEGYEPGSAYLFRWNGTDWMQEDRLTPAPTGEHHDHGFDLALDGDRVVLGSQDNRVTLFERDPSQQWTEGATITGPPDSFFFGQSVASDGDRIAISNPRDDDRHPGSGAVFLYQWDGQDFALQRQLVRDGSSRLGQGLHFAQGALFVGSVDAVAVWDGQLHTAVRPGVLQPGDAVEIEVCGGWPGSLGLFVLLDDGRLVRITTGFFDAMGSMRIGGPVPPALSGLEFPLAGLGFDAQGTLRLSEPATLRVQ